MFFINGSYVNEADAKISVLDLGILRGFGIFDYLRTYSRKPFHLWDHLLRLQHSANQLQLELPYGLEEISTIVEKVLTLNNYPEASLKIIVTGGISPDQFTPQQPATLIIFAYPLVPYPDEWFSKGISVVTTTLTRHFPSCKTTQYIAGILAIQKGHPLQAKEALYLNAKGQILEATTSNFFGVKQGKLYTCLSDEVLSGITRQIILNIASQYFEICLDPIGIDEIDQLDEAFLTASNKEVMPVTAIDAQPIGDGRVGPVTSQVIHLFRQYTQQKSWLPLSTLSFQQGPS